MNLCLLLNALAAAAVTPLDAAGNLNLASVPPFITDELARNGGRKLAVCGGSVEGPALTREAREVVTNACVEAKRGRKRTIIHEGRACLREARLPAEPAANRRPGALGFCDWASVEVGEELGS